MFKRRNDRSVNAVQCGAVRYDAAHEAAYKATVYIIGKRLSSCRTTGTRAPTHDDTQRYTRDSREVRQVRTTRRYKVIGAKQVHGPRNLHLSPLPLSFLSTTTQARMRPIIARGNRRSSNFPPLSSISMSHPLTNTAVRHTRRK